MLRRNLKKFSRCISTMIRDDLNSCTIDNTPVISFFDITTKCKVLKVIDENKITIAIPFNYSIYKVTCVLNDNGIIDNEYKKFLLRLVENKIVFIHCGYFDTCGNLLGKLYLSKEEYNKETSIYDTYNNYRYYIMK